MPFLTYPLALIALSALPALAAIYFFRNRFRKHPVSSIALWQRISQPKQGGSRLTRFQTPLWFLLELLAIILLVLAAVDPRWPMTGKRRPLTVVLDDSASMLAEDDSGATPQREALEMIAGLLGSSRYRIASVILAGTDTQLLDSDTDEFDLAGIKKRWQCKAPRAETKSALALGLQTSPGTAPLLVLTDSPPEEKIDNERVKWHSFGVQSPNLGFVNASRSPGEIGDRCLIEIANYSDTDRETEVRLAGVAAEPVSKTLSLESGEKKIIIFPAPPSAERITATLPKDSLEIDNQITLLKPVLKQARVKVAITNQTTAEFVKRAISSTGLQSEETGSPDMIITDQRNPALNSSEWIVQLSSGDDPHAYTGPFVIDRNHPLTKGLYLEGVIWGAAHTNLPNGELPVVMAGNVPLVTDTAGLRDNHLITIQYSPRLSTLQRSPAWPVLFWNIMRWRTRNLPGFSQINLRTGQKITYQTDAAIDAVEIQSPAGDSALQPVSAGEAVLRPQTPGIYRVKEGDTEHQFAANFLSPSESDLSGTQGGEWGKLIGSETIQREMRSSAWLFKLLALLVLTAHLVAISRSNNRKQLRVDKI